MYAVLCCVSENDGEPLGTRSGMGLRQQKKGTQRDIIRMEHQS